MGANEKHAATYHGREYTPDAEQLRDLWVDSKLDHLPRWIGIPLIPSVQAEFARWLEQFRAEAKAEALREAADVMPGSAWENAARSWLRARANQYKENQS